MNRPSPTTFAMMSVVLLAGLVAAASHTSVWAPARQGDARLTLLLSIVALATLSAAAVVGIGSTVRHRGRHLEKPVREKVRQALPVMVVAIALISLAAISRIELQRYRGPRAEVGSVDLTSGREGVRLNMDWRGSAVRRGGVERGAEGVALDRPGGPPLLLWMILLTGAVASAALARAWWSSRRSERDPHQPAVPDAHRQAAHSAVINSIDAMLADPDPHTAIIGAYARLLEELASNGVPREEYEGPREHLHRVLTVLDVRAGALERLTRLFEEARFSTHSMTGRHRDHALDALREVAGDLMLPALTPTGGSRR